MGISAVVHTYNSEKHLEQCLESIKTVDEIVLCDMHSTDRTIEIAEKYNCKIIYYENVGFADPAREFAINHAGNEWIFVVDSDEIIPSQLLDYIRAEIQKPECKDSFNIPEKNIIWGKFLNCAYPDMHRRCFKKSAFISWPAHIHAVPIIEGEAHEIQPKNKHLAIIHHSYPTIESFINKMNKYTSFEAEKLVKQDFQKFSLFYALFRAKWEFLKRYFLKNGYKDGIHGFIFCYMMALYKFLALIKFWELKYNQSDN